ncbi:MULTISPECIES: ABC transporter permease [Streptomyces]|uniref:ABC transporter permease n=1 Tax=Streptomyces xanthii TaxID=2768069 RepID=A0A7H1B5J8_9ACTN|nr:ABC transporter permease [Streptomyces xanthii]QNS04003.1 ABC transporter permease [Streptomyces xanthii]
MLAYLLRRLFAAAVMLVVIVMVVFCIFFLVPKWAGADIALNFVGKQADPAAIEGVREKLRLGDPIYLQVWEFFKGIFVGRTYSGGGDVTQCAAPCFGYSFRTEQAVWPVLTDRFPVTLGLALGAAVLWLIFGLAAGVLSALKRGSLWDRGAMVIALAGVSLPIYFTGLLSLAIFAFGLDWIDAQYVPFTDSVGGYLGGMILPWITLAFLYAAMYARITRATMLEILGEDYIRTARAKGLKEQVVIGKHAMRSTMTPILTMLGMDLGALIGGAILTESTFNLPGLGRAVLDAIRTQDLPIILGVTLITSLAVLLANLVVDILYAVIDPRVRLA